jgi:hypothetical protein
MLVFSINKAQIEQNFIFQSLDQFLSKATFEQKIILIADTLRTKSYKVIDRYSMKRAREICLELGGKMLELVKKKVSRNNNLSQKPKKYSNSM